jgi:PAS domain S-box-containing protein
MVRHYRQRSETMKAVDDARRQAEEHRQLLQTTLQSMGDALITTDGQGHITYLNPVAERLTAWGTEVARGRPLKEIFHIINAHTREMVESPADKVFELGEVVGLANHTVLIARDGTERQISDSGAPIRNAAGEITGVVLVFHDVTEQYQLEEQMRQTQKMDAIGQLAGGIAHDFNNMLGGILGYAEILTTRLNDNHTLERYARTIVETADRAAELTNKLLSFSRKGKAISTCFDLHKSIDDALELLRHSLDRTITIDRRLNAEFSTVIGDPTQLQNGFLNLGVNARDAMPEGGTLTVETENAELDRAYCSASPFEIQPGPVIQVTLRDTGCGIPPDIQRQIFEPFFTTKETGQGTGLGLAAVYGTIKEHQGVITVYSEESVGTTFHIYLPLAQESHAAAHTALSAEAPVRGEGCILIVDDEAVIRNMAREILTELGYEVLLAEDGQEGVDVYKEKQEKIDLVILDLVMPKMSGRDCFQALRKIDPEVKVILSSGFARDTSVSDLFEAGAVGFVKKPYRGVALSQAVSRCLHAPS